MLPGLIARSSAHDRCHLRGNDARGWLVRCGLNRRYMEAAGAAVGLMVARGHGQRWPGRSQGSLLVGSRLLERFRLVSAPAG